MGPRRLKKPRTKCLEIALESMWVPISDEEEGDILFDSVAKSSLDPFDTSSGSVQLIAIKPVALPPVHPTSDRSQETANGEVNKALKQKSDIEHYRNKLRLKAKRKGYYDFPQVDNNKGLVERKKMYENAQNEIDHILDPDTDGSSPFVEPKNRTFYDEKLNDNTKAFVY
uniref:Uncharacterized protein n=1 Tax=Sphaerodactylus townsendi TaxID=933632 RepID=A0ACB8G3Q1_9SAUR